MSPFGATPVLVVDDSATIRKVLSSILEEAGYAVVTAEDGADTKRKLQHTYFDIALVDLVLPDSDGIELLKLIRKRNPNANVIMLSGQGTYEVAVEALNNGAFAYLKKPVNEDEVKAHVQRAVERLALVKENRARTEALEKANLDLIEANAELTRLTDLQKRFVSIVAHELRTPMTVIQGYSDTILRYYEDLDEGRIRSYLSMMQDESQRLSRLIEELLDLSRIQSGKLTLNYQAVDIKESVANIFKQMSFVRPDLEFVADFQDGSATINTDRDKIGQVFLNLIGNALKYSPTGGTIAVRAVPEGENVTVKVIDQGPGIPREAFDKIFQGFFRVDNASTQKTPGAGLGLAITKGIVEAMGGKIWLESEFGKGSTFAFSVPKAHL